MADASRDTLDALGDPNRREILRLLGASKRSVQEIASGLPISRPAVSRHLRVLGEAGLVVDHRSGTRRVYELRDESMLAVQRYLEQVWCDTAARFRLFAENAVGTPDCD